MVDTLLTEFEEPQAFAESFASPSALQLYIDDLMAASSAADADSAQATGAHVRDHVETSTPAYSPTRKAAYDKLSEREALFVKRLQIAQSRSRFSRMAQSENHVLVCDVFSLSGHLLAIPSSAIDRVSKIGRVSAAMISSAHKHSSTGNPALNAWTKKYRELRAILSRQVGGEKNSVDPIVEGDAGPLNPDDALAIAEQGRSGLSVRLKGSERFIFVEQQLASVTFTPNAIEFAEYALDEWSSELNGGLVGAAVDDNADLVYLFDPLQLDRISDARHVLGE